MYQVIQLRIKRWVQPELDRTYDLLHRANRQLDNALRENSVLRVRNEELNVQVNNLDADNKDLRKHVERLEKAKDMMADTMANMERQQKAAEKTQEATNDAVRMLQNQITDLRAQLGLMP